MKKYISLMLLLLCVCFLQAQEKIVILKKGAKLPGLEKGTYYKTPEATENGKSFEGFWEYKNGTENLKLKIGIKKVFMPKLEFYIDKLTLEYFYDNGDSNIISNDSEDNFLKSGSAISGTKAHFMCYDMVKKKNFYIDLELLNNNQIKMALTNVPGGIRINPTTKTDFTFSLPTDIILTKQNL
ncbi:DUF6705 family protein [Sphingobacterium sp. ML3W]|uniref:DUF6705 family protein n=1 Tax=Sphingobacterium sp. ML3W TaxID=1538644 RepID=UPI000A4199EE|nr:DUF6705 family protein [Sphingobacterium sp. ML3W]